MLKSWSGKLTQIDPHRILVFLATVWALAFDVPMVDTNLSDPKRFEESDYIMTFYVAGYLGFWSGRKLYPPPNDCSFTIHGSIKLRIDWFPLYPNNHRQYIVYSSGRMDFRTI